MMIQAQQLVKQYGTGNQIRRVLDHVSLAMPKGEFAAVMGPSGSGKSTLLFALSTMDRVDEGKIVFNGQDISRLPDAALSALRRTQMGFVFQQATMLKNLSILDNIILPAVRDNRGHTQAIVERARQLMAQMGIAELAERDITQVSGGQLQRAGICRALIAEPHMLFADEPTGALNSQTAEEIMDIFTDIHTAGATLLLVTHDARVAARSQRVLFMRDGAIVEQLTLPRYTLGDDLTARRDRITEAMRTIGI